MSELLTSGNAKLHAHHWPVDQAVSVMVLIHGFGEHGGRYGPMASYLNSQKIAVVGADLRGHGRTKGKRGAVSYTHLTLPTKRIV